MEADGKIAFLDTKKFYSFSYLCFFIACLFQSYGKISADTKLDLAINPDGFLGRALHLWSSAAPMGQVQNQAYGYFFPQGTFYIIAHYCGIPAWISQRLWWSVLLTIGFIGFIRLAQALGIGTRFAQIIAAVAYALSPRMLTTIASISSESLPYLLAPWMLYGVVLALKPTQRSSTEKPLWKIAAGTSCAFALTGAVNAVATIAALSPAIVWLLMHRQDRRWKIFTIWWISTGMVVSLWWLIPLSELGKISPPFLDYIESSHVTTEWTSLTEVLRGTGTWSPFVSQLRPAGYLLTTNWVAVLATGLIAVCGLMALAMVDMPHRKQLIVLLCCGLLIYCTGYAGSGDFSCSSPISSWVRDFLDGTGKAFRNVHKWEPLIRIPIDLGICYFLGRASYILRDKVTIPYSAMPSIFPHIKLPVGLVRLISSSPPPIASVLVGIPALLLLSLMPLVSNSLVTENSFTQIPDYWYDAAKWLDKNNTQGRVLVVPGAPFADQRWGYTSDFPLQVLSHTPWAVRDAIPLTPPGAIRFNDSIEQRLESGYDAPGLADTLAAAGFSYVLVAGDYDTNHARSLTPFLALQTLHLSPGFSLEAQFGISGPSTMKHIVVDDGLVSPVSGVSIFAIHSSNFTKLTGIHILSADAIRQLHAGPEAITTINQSAALLGIPPLIATSLAGDTGWETFGPAPIIVTDTPALHETDYGRVFDNQSAIRTYDDPHTVLNKKTDYESPGNKVVGQWTGAQVSVSSSASDATQLGKVLISHSPSAAFDHNLNTSWVSRNLTSAVGQWMKITFPTSTRILVRLTTAQVLGPDVTTVKVTTDAGSAYTQGLSPQKSILLTVPSGATKSVMITAVGTSDNTMGNQFAISELEIIDADTFREIPIGYQIVLPTIRPGVQVSDWILAPLTVGRSECITSADQAIMCSRALGAAPDNQGYFQRLLSVPSAIDVVPNLFVRSINSSVLNDMLKVPGITVIARTHIADPRGNVLALTDGSYTTTWTGTDGDQHNGINSNKIVLHLDKVVSINRIRISASSAKVPAKVRTVAINLGKGRLIRHIRSGQWIDLPMTNTDTISIMPLSWQRKSNVNDLGYASTLAPGISEVDMGHSVEVINQSHDQHRTIVTSCDNGPILSAGNRILHFSVSATEEQLANHSVVRAIACDTNSVLSLPPGRDNITVIPSGAFTVAGVELHNFAVPPVFTTIKPQSLSVSVWNSVRRDVDIAAANYPRVIFVPESVNAGWKATIGRQDLRSISINGWEQGWLIPAGISGTVQIRFLLDKVYRAALFIGLPLVAVVGICTHDSVSLPLGWLPRRMWKYVLARRKIAALPHSFPRWIQYLGLMVFSVVISSYCGLLICTAILSIKAAIGRYKNSNFTFLHRYSPIIGINGASAVCLLSRHPWQSFEIYAGYKPYAQILSFIAVCLLLLSCIDGPSNVYPQDSPETDDITPQLEDLL